MVVGGGGGMGVVWWVEWCGWGWGGVCVRGERGGGVTVVCVCVGEVEGVCVFCGLLSCSSGWVIIVDPQEKWRQVSANVFNLCVNVHVYVCMLAAMFMQVGGQANFFCWFCLCLRLCLRKCFEVMHFIVAFGMCEQNTYGAFCMYVCV